MVEKIDVAVIGGGPAGLAACESLLAAGRAPVLFEAKPSVARKFLMAGKSGLNLTKEEPGFLDVFCDEMRPFVEGFDARGWAEGLEEEMFTGSTGRVFPRAMKASPLLRKWLARLEAVELRTRWRWEGFDGPRLCFDQGRKVQANAEIFALGGGSWPRLGSDGGWIEAFEGAGVEVAPLEPSNMGFDVAWSTHFAERFAGEAVKTIEMRSGPRAIKGEFAVTASGIEGGVVYAQSAALREALMHGDAQIELDLLPGRSFEAVRDRLARPRKKLSRSNFLRKAVGLTGVKAGLLRECCPKLGDDAGEIAQVLKALPIRIEAPRPLDEAISSAGGVAWNSIDAALMLLVRPGSFVAGEMLNWEAPTGGYLLTGCMGSGFAAGRGAVSWLERKKGQ